MTYSNGLKSVVSGYSAPRKSSIKNLSLFPKRSLIAKDFLKDSGSPQQKIGDFTQSKLARWSA